MATIDDGQGDLSGGGDGRSPEAVERLVRLAADGDEAAWRTLVDVYARRVFALLRSRGCDRELAEELTQGAFVKVARVLGRGGYSEQGKFEAWLFRIAMNGLRDEMRRRKRQANPTDFADAPPESIGLADADGHDGGPAQPLIDAEQADALHAAIAELPDADRELIHLRYTAGLGYQEIADALEQPLGTVLARGHRALKKLKSKLLAADANAA